MPFCAPLTSSLQMALYHHPKYPFRKKTNLKQLKRAHAEPPRGARWSAMFLPSHPDGFLGIKQGESTRFCTSSLLYHRPGWELLGRWVLIYTNPCSAFSWSIWSLLVLKMGHRLNRPWEWPCLAIPMGGNRETSQEASMRPKIYTRGCDVSNWMSAIKSADSFSSVMCGISITFSVTVLHPIKTHWTENTVVEVTLCSW